MWVRRRGKDWLAVRRQGEGDMAEKQRGGLAGRKKRGREIIKGYKLLKQINSNKF